METICNLVLRKKWDEVGRLDGKAGNSCHLLMLVNYTALDIGVTQVIESTIYLKAL